MFLKELLKRKKEQIAELQKRSDASQDLAEVRSIGEQVKALNGEVAEIEAELRRLEQPDETEQREKAPESAELRNGVVVGQFGTAEKENDMEYRQAFMNYMLRGVKIPAELRQSENTTTTDVSAVIPTTLVNKIIEKFDNVGMILPLINKTSYKAGVEIPVSSAKPTASWVGTSGNSGEGNGSDRKKKTVNTKITFAYYKLRCEISMSMEVGTMALSSFETKFIENVSKAMVKAIEEAIINGTGTSQPKGILKETPESGQLLKKTLTYAHLCDAEGVLPVEYETGAKWCMNKKTFAKVLGMVDEAGQPIARVNYGIAGKQERTILGRDVVIAPYVADDKMFMFDFADYTLNTLYDMGISKKQDWDTEDLLTKAVMSVDGKVTDKGSLVLFEVQSA